MELIQSNPVTPIPITPEILKNISINECFGYKDYYEKTTQLISKSMDLCDISLEHLKKNDTTDDRTNLIIDLLGIEDDTIYDKMYYYLNTIFFSMKNYSITTTDVVDAISKTFGEDNAANSKAAGEKAITEYPENENACISASIIGGLYGLGAGEAAAKVVANNNQPIAVLIAAAVAAGYAISQGDVAENAALAVFNGNAASVGKVLGEIAKNVDTSFNKDSSFVIAAARANGIIFSVADDHRLAIEYKDDTNVVNETAKLVREIVLPFIIYQTIRPTLVGFVVPFNMPRNRLCTTIFFMITANKIIYDSTEQGRERALNIGQNTAISLFNRPGDPETDDTILFSWIEEALTTTYSSDNSDKINAVAAAESIFKTINGDGKSMRVIVASFIAAYISNQGISNQDISIIDLIVKIIDDIIIRYLALAGFTRNNLLIFCCASFLTADAALKATGSRVTDAQIAFNSAIANAILNNNNILIESVKKVAKKVYYDQKAINDASDDKKDEVRDQQNALVNFIGDAAGAAVDARNQIVVNVRYSTIAGYAAAAAYYAAKKTARNRYDSSFKEYSEDKTFSSNGKFNFYKYITEYGNGIANSASIIAGQISSEVAANNGDFGTIAGCVAGYSSAKNINIEKKYEIENLQLYYNYIDVYLEALNRHNLQNADNIRSAQFFAVLSIYKVDDVAKAAAAAQVASNIGINLDISTAIGNNDDQKLIIIRLYLAACTGAETTIASPDDRADAIRTGTAAAATVTAQGQAALAANNTNDIPSAILEATPVGRFDNCEKMIIGVASAKNALDNITAEDKNLLESDKAKIEADRVVVDQMNNDVINYAALSAQALVDANGDLNAKNTSLAIAKTQAESALGKMNVNYLNKNVIIEMLQKATHYKDVVLLYIANDVDAIAYVNASITQVNNDFAAVTDISIANAVNNRVAAMNALNDAMEIEPADTNEAQVLAAVTALNNAVILATRVSAEVLHIFDLIVVAAVAIRNAVIASNTAICMAAATAALNNYVYFDFVDPTTRIIASITSASTYGTADVRRQAGFEFVKNACPYISIYIAINTQAVINGATGVTLNKFALAFAGAAAHDAAKLILTNNSLRTYTRNRDLLIPVPYEAAEQAALQFMNVGNGGVDNFSGDAAISSGNVYTQTIINNGGAVNARNQAGLDAVRVRGNVQAGQAAYIAFNEAQRDSSLHAANFSYTNTDFTNPGEFAQAVAYSAGAAAAKHNGAAVNLYIPSAGEVVAADFIGSFIYVNGFEMDATFKHSLSIISAAETSRKFYEKIIEAPDIGREKAQEIVLNITADTPLNAYPSAIQAAREALNGSSEPYTFEQYTTAFVAATKAITNVNLPTIPPTIIEAFSNKFQRVYELALAPLQSKISINDKSIIFDDIYQSVIKTMNQHIKEDITKSIETYPKIREAIRNQNFEEFIQGIREFIRTIVDRLIRNSFKTIGINDLKEREKEKNDILERIASFNRALQESNSQYQVLKCMKTGTMAFSVINFISANDKIKKCKSLESNIKAFQESIQSSNKELLTITSEIELKQNEKKNKQTSSLNAAESEQLVTQTVQLDIQKTTFSVMRAILETIKLKNTDISQEEIDRYIQSSTTELDFIGNFEILKIYISTLKSSFEAIELSFKSIIVANGQPHDDLDKTSFDKNKTDAITIANNNISFFTETCKKVKEIINVCKVQTTELFEDMLDLINRIIGSDFVTKVKGLLGQIEPLDNYNTTDPYDNFKTQASYTNINGFIENLETGYNTIFDAVAGDDNITELQNKIIEFTNYFVPPQQPKPSNEIEASLELATIINDSVMKSVSPEILQIRKFYRNFENWAICPKKSMAEAIFANIGNKPEEIFVQSIIAGIDKPLTITYGEKELQISKVNGTVQVMVDGNSNDANYLRILYSSYLDPQLIPILSRGMKMNIIVFSDKDRWFGEWYGSFPSTYNKSIIVLKDGDVYLNCNPPQFNEKLLSIKNGHDVKRALPKAYDFDIKETLKNNNVVDTIQKLTSLYAGDDFTQSAKNYKNTHSLQYSEDFLKHALKTIYKNGSDISMLSLYYEKYVQLSATYNTDDIWFVLGTKNLEFSEMDNCLSNFIELLRHYKEEIDRDIINKSLIWKLLRVKNCDFEQTNKELTEFKGKSAEEQQKFVLEQEANFDKEMALLNYNKLIKLGYGERDVRKALLDNKGNLKEALKYLINVVNDPQICQNNLDENVKTIKELFEYIRPSNQWYKNWWKGTNNLSSGKIKNLLKESNFNVRTTLEELFRREEDFIEKNPEFGKKSAQMPQSAQTPGQMPQSAQTLAQTPQNTQTPGQTYPTQEQIQAIKDCFLVLTPKQYPPAVLKAVFSLVTRNNPKDISPDKIKKILTPVMPRLIRAINKKLKKIRRPTRKRGGMTKRYRNYNKITKRNRHRKTRKVTNLYSNELLL
jgi:hypothetical protein